MGPKSPTPAAASGDLYRSRLENLLDHRHELYRLAGLIEWEQFDRAFGRFYRPLGRPAKLTRLMVGLSYLKHVFDLSDEAVCTRWRENPYWQFFCGCEYFEHDLPCDPSSLTRWRGRIGPAGMEKLLAATVQAGLKSGTVKPSSLERVSIDTTVQPKAIAHPTDSRLYLKAIQALVRQAKRHGLRLRQTYTRLAKRAAAQVARYAHARQMRRMRRELKRPKTYLGRVHRDVGRKVAAMDAAASAVAATAPAAAPAHTGAAASADAVVGGGGTLHMHFAPLLGLVERLLTQERTSKNKLYSLHAPEVVCIAKG